jgi:long-chain fatty acid transport protein
MAGLWLSAHARAGGYEDTASGTIGLGRAANAGRVQDFLATWQNPANLAVVPGTDLGLELRLPVLDACFDRARAADVEYRDPGSDRTGEFMGSESFQNVCNEGSLSPSGNIGWAQSFDSGWGWGVGIFTPASVGNLKFGRDTIVTWPPYFDDEQYATTLTGEESPTRQLLIAQESSGAWLGAGVGYQVMPQLRVGLGLSAGFVRLKTSVVSSLIGGTFRDQEGLSELDVTDWFVPRAIASVVGSPIDSLDLFGIVTLQDDVNATGDAVFTSNGIQGAPLFNCRDSMPGPHCGVQDVKARIPFPNWETTVGARYAQRRNARTRVLDPMRDEVWDVELEGSWTGTSHVDAYSVHLYDGMPGDDSPGLQTNSTPNSIRYPLTQDSSVPKRWRDTLSLRLGSDFNIVRGRLAVRAGMSYASSAVRLEYMNIDVWPVQKIGLHLGATMAFDNLKLSFAYAHLFYERVQVPVGTGAVNETVTLNPEKAQAVNEGDYRAAQDIISVQANVRF